MKIYLAIKNGETISIEDVESGLNCGCVCIKCKQPLVAKKGEINVHHFAHHSLSNCTGGKETQIHHLAKHYFLEHKFIELPKLQFKHQGNKVFKSFSKVKYNNVILEKPFDGFKPDVVLEFGDKQLFVEVALHSFVKDEKYERIKNYGISCIEIDLNPVLSYDIVSFQNLKRSVYRIVKDITNSKWIYNASKERIIKNTLNRLDSFAVKGRGYLHNKKCSKGGACVNCEYAIDFVKHEAQKGKFNERYTVSCGLKAGVNKQYDYLGSMLKYTRKPITDIQGFLREQRKEWLNDNDFFQQFKYRGFSIRTSRLKKDFIYRIKCYTFPDGKMHEIQAEYDGNKFVDLPEGYYLFCFKELHKRQDNMVIDEQKSFDRQYNKFMEFYTRAKPVAGAMVFLLVYIHPEFYEVEGYFDGNEWQSDVNEAHTVLGWNYDSYITQ